MPTVQPQDKPKSIVVSKANGLLPPLDNLHRAVHKIRSTALCHNYSEVESAANRQRCSVIVVVKADGYGHGAIATALFLADNMGADAFAVATLEEGIALRKAFQNSGSKHRNLAPKNHVASLFQNPADDISSIATSKMSQRRSMRPSHIRILVLGPPVGFPRCFDDYHHHNIEVMISGPEVARALLEWVYNTEERRRTQVERAAAESKELAMKSTPPPPRTVPVSKFEHGDSNVSEKSVGDSSQDSASNTRIHHPSATLGNVTGSDLAKEVREILKIQQLAKESKEQQKAQQAALSGASISPSPVRLDQTVPAVSDLSMKNCTTSALAPPQVFAGIEEAAKNSRTRQKVVTSEVFLESGEDDDEVDNDKKKTPTLSRQNTPPMNIPRKRLRWHALVDSGMGRLGFRTDPVGKDEKGRRRDSVQIIKELVDLEVALNCPIEFFGMCTHMADATSTSDYTNAQIVKFKSLLKRVRGAGISVPTLSTDNSAALLTTDLKHFDPNDLLAADTRGYVRTGGAIYGQRPAFSQLRAVSTLVASVRHVAILKAGESVGYDRAYIAPMNVRIATLTIGFADGYPRELGNGAGKVAIRGHLFPVAGNVCMDMLMVELGPAEEKHSAGAQVVVGDTAILWGPADEENGEGLVPLKEIATFLKTTQSALTCGLDKERVLRQYD